MRILFLSRWLPYPPDNGSKIRIHNILRQLSRRHEVALLAFRDSAERADDGVLRALRENCRSVQVLPYRSFSPSSPKALLGLLSTTPRSLVDTHSKEMAAAVSDEFGRNGSDVVVASQLAMAPYALMLPEVPALLEELELSALLDRVRQSRWPRRLRSALTWLKLSAYLRRVLPRFDACTVVSERERANLQRVVPAYSKVHIVPNALDLTRYEGDFGPARPRTLVYPGALTYDANYDAVRYFLESIYPTVVDAVPDALFQVTGGNAGVDLSRLARQRGVLFTGHVADVRPVLAQSWATVVPLRRGGGTRLKILESMALGTPVVSTPKGAEGLEVTDGEDILIADGPKEFAARVVDLLLSPDLRDRLAAGGRRLVSSAYDWNVVGQTFCALVEHVAGGADRRLCGEGRLARICG